MALTLKCKECHLCKTSNLLFFINIVLFLLPSLVAFLYLFFLFLVRASPPFIFWMSFCQALKGSAVGAEALSQFLQRAVQSCLYFSYLCGRAVLTASESAGFIFHAQGHDLDDYFPLLSSPLFHMLPKMSITQSWN